MAPAQAATENGVLQRGTADICVCKEGFEAMNRTPKKIIEKLINRKSNKTGGTSPKGDKLLYVRSCQESTLYTPLPRQTSAVPQSPPESDDKDS